ncbi:MAG: VOC family protein [Solirubrobacteraceae bacterium]
MSHRVMFFEVVGSDGAALRDFYRRLFSWRITDVAASMDYGMVARKDAGIDGGIGATPNGGAGHTTFYVESDDPQATLTRAHQLGGRTLLAPTALPGGGVIALLADSEGHPVGLYRPAPTVTHAATPTAAATRSGSAASGVASRIATPPSPITNSRDQEGR